MSIYRRYLTWTAPLAIVLAFRASAPTVQRIIQIQSPRKTFHLEVVEKPDGSVASYYYDVFVVSNRKEPLKRRLPPQRIEDADTDQVGFAGDFHISPDDRWIFREQKVVHATSVGSLYYRRGEVDFRPASLVRFDEAAWRYYAKTVGWRISRIPGLDAPRMIGFLSWSSDSRRLVFEAWSSHYGKRNQMVEWVGCFDTRRRRFVPPTKAERAQRRIS